MTPQADIPIILIVESAPDGLGEAVPDLLEGQGYRVAIAREGKAALRRAQRVSPDLILLDVMLPDMDGFELCRRLKTQKKTRDIPVMFMAARLTAEQTIKAFEAGGVDCLAKPLQPAEVRVRVATHLKLRIAQRRLEEKNAQLERRIAEREQQFHTLAGNSQNNIIRYDLEGRIVYVNPQLEATLGTAAKDVLGKTPLEISGGRFADLQARIAEVIETGQDQEFGLVLPDTGAGIRRHHVRFVAEYGTNGTIVGVLGIGRDITESKQREHELEILNRAVDVASEAAFLMDARGRFVYVNGAACRSLQYSRDELLTMSPLDIDPDISREAFEGLLQAMFSGRPTGGAVESRHRARDGHVFPVEMTASVVEYDNTQFCLVMTRDISERRAAELQRHASEQVFRAVVEHSPDAMARYDRDCRRIFVNRATQTMFGAPAERLLGKTPAEYSGLKDGEGFTKTLRQVFESGKERQLEVAFRNALGETGWGHARMVPEFDAEGVVVSVLSIARDITALKNSEMSFRTLTENSPDHIARYDRHCRLRYQNPRLEALWGEAARALIGKSPLEAFPGGEYADYQARIAAVIETGKESEIEITVPDRGEGVRYHQVRFVAERDSDGEIVGALAIGRDVTESRRLQRELEIHNIALNTSTDAVFLQDKSFHFVFVNNTACRSLGYSREELLTMEPFDIDPDLTLDMVRMKMESIIKNGGVFKFEARHRAKDGRIFPVEISTSQFEYEGDVFGLSIVRDITERKRLEETFRFVAQRGWHGNGQGFFDALVNFLGQTLGVDYVLVGKLHDAPGWAETTALYAKGAVAANVRYKLAGSPCESVIGKNYCWYPEGIQQLFPEDDLLVEMGVESYAGIPLWDSGGAPLGLIVILDGKPLPDDSVVARLLQVVAPRAAAELERARSDALLRTREREFRSLAESLPDCVIRYDLAGRMLYLNTVLVRQLGLSDASEVIGKLPIEAWPDGRYGDIGRLVAQVMETGAEASIDISAPGPSGELEFFEIRAVPEWDEVGHMIGTIAVGRNITALKRYEQTLRASEQQFRSLAENAPDNIARYDRQGRHIYVNPKLEESTGLAAREMLGRTPEDLFPGGSNASIHRVAETGEPVDSEIVLPDIGAGVRYHSIHLAPEFGEDGEIIAVLGIGRDITERKQAELERQSYIGFLQALDRIDRAIQGTNDIDTMMHDVLDVVLEIFDCDRAFLLYPCDPAAVGFRVLMERTNPEFPGALALGESFPRDDEIAEKLRILLEADSPVTFGPGGDHPLPAGISARFGVQSLLSMAIHPRIDVPWEFGIQQCSRVRAWTNDEEHLLHEIGRRLSDGLTGLLAYRQLRERELHLLTLVQTIPDLIWLKSPGGVFLRCNQQFVRFIGAKEEDIVGKTDYDVRDRESAEFYRENDRQILASGKPSITEEWLTFAADGYRGLFEVTRTPLHDAAGNTLGILGIAHDITQRKAMEDALRASEREFRSLAENLPDIVMRYDLGCRCSYVNPAYLQEMDEVSGESALNEAPPLGYWRSSTLSLEDYRKSLRAVMNSGQPAELLVDWMRGSSGVPSFHALHIVAERDVNERVIGALCIGRNITGLMETERRLEASRRQLRDLAARREDAREEERRHIAREIHDGLGQQLTALRFSVTMLDFEFGETQPRVREAAGQLLQQVNGAIQAARVASATLRPPVLDMGIVPALEWLVAEYAPHGGVSLELKGKASSFDLNDAHTVVVFRIVQESLTNAVRHSKADRIQVILGRDVDAHVVEVVDNGIGFDPGAPRDHRSVGLIGIRERVHAVGGEVLISSSPGRGTALRVRIPVESEGKEES